jgi:hypothetical protein
MTNAEYPAEMLLEHRMEHLPPLKDAPILETLDRVGAEHFREQFAIETPTYKNGTVNHRALVEKVSRLVAPDYRWVSPYFDEHHLYWPSADYELPAIAVGGGGMMQLRQEGGNDSYRIEVAKADPSSTLTKWIELDPEVHSNDPEFNELLDFVELETFDAETIDYFRLTEEFKELSINKLWVPRQFHNFIHAVTKPPDMPERPVMERIVRNARLREYLFQIATSAYTITERLDQAVELILPQGEAVLFDNQRRRVYRNQADMERRKERFIEEIMNHHQNGFIDLSRLASLEVVDARSVERSLGVIATRVTAGMLIKTRTNSKARRVDLPTRGLTHTVWLRSEENAA